MKGRPIYQLHVSAQLGERVLSGEPGSETDPPFQRGDTSELRPRIEVSDYDDPIVVPANTGRKKTDNWIRLIFKEYKPQ